MIGMARATEIRIREADSHDREAFQQLMLEAYKEYERLLSAAKWEKYQEEMRRSVEGDGPAARLVAEMDGEMVGCVQLYTSSEAAYGLPEIGIHAPIIRFLSVLPKARGRGVATALIAESARRSLQLGSSTLYLHTTDMMESAIRLYERLGFERSCDKDFWNGETLVKSYRLRVKETVIR